MNREIYAEIMDIYARRRTEAHQRAAQLRERMRAQYPQVADIERRMASAAGQVVTAVLNGGDTAAEVARIRKENLALQQELADLLHQAGEQADNFEPLYVCAVCEDTGAADGKRCACFDALLREVSVRRLQRFIPLNAPTFAELTPQFYSDTPDASDGSSPRSRMEQVLTFCRCYGEDFSTQSQSLLLRGATGTGKTQVSLAVARMAAERGYSVVYGPAGQLFHRLEREHFGRAEGDSMDEMTTCDLLIMDDLGTEFGGTFITACLYEILNTRLLNGLPTIISTNLTAAQMTDRYGEAVTSRIIGTFMPVMFYGKDIRLEKLRQTIG